MLITNIHVYLLIDRKKEVEADTLDLPTESNLRPNQVLVTLKDNPSNPPIYPDDYNFVNKLRYFYDNDEENDELVELNNNIYLMDNFNNDNYIAKSIESYDGVNQVIKVSAQQIGQPKLYFNKTEFYLSLAAFINNNLNSVQYTFPTVYQYGEYRLRDLFYQDESSSTQLPYGFNGQSIVRFNPNLERLQNYRLQHNASYTIENLMSDNTKNGITKNSNIIVDVDVPDITQISNYSITSNGSQNIPIPTGYDAVDSINVNVAVPQSVLQSNKVTNLNFNGNSGLTFNYSITPDSGYNAMEVASGIIKFTNVTQNINIGTITNYSISSNGNQNIPMPIGKLAVSSISVNVNVPSTVPVCNNVKNDYNDIRVLTSNFLTSSTNDNYISIPSGKVIIAILELTDFYIVRIMASSNNYTSIYTDYRPYKYYIFDDYVQFNVFQFEFCSSSNSVLFSVNDHEAGDSEDIQVNIYKTMMLFNFS